MWAVRTNTTAEPKNNNKGDLQSWEYSKQHKYQSNCCRHCVKGAAAAPHRTVCDSSGRRTASQRWPSAALAYRCRAERTPVDLSQSGCGDADVPPLGPPLGCGAMRPAGGAVGALFFPVRRRSGYGRAGSRLDSPSLPPSLLDSNLTVTGSGAFRAAVENRSLLPVAVTLEGLELRHPWAPFQP